MPPLKLEDNIRDQFHNREITPSDEAWEQLASRLDEVPKQKNRGFGAWWSVAAGVAGLALVGSLLWSGDPAQQQPPMVMEELLPQNERSQQPVIPSIPLEQELDQQEESTVAVTSEIEAGTNPHQKGDLEEVVQQEKAAIAVSQTPNQTEVIRVDSQDREELVVEVNTAGMALQTTDGVTAKVDEVVGKIKELESTNTQVTEAEIAELLHQAQLELKTKSVVNMETLKVDANALLMDVEFDLERSFRDRVFDALGDGYNKIRTAMASRNN